METFVDWISVIGFVFLYLALISFITKKSYGLIFEGIGIFLLSFCWGYEKLYLALLLMSFTVIIAGLFDPFVWKWRMREVFPKIDKTTRILSWKINSSLGLVLVFAFGLGAIVKFFV